MDQSQRYKDVPALWGLLHLLSNIRRKEQNQPWESVALENVLGHGLAFITKLHVDAYCFLIQS